MEIGILQRLIGEEIRYRIRFSDSKSDVVIELESGKLDDWSYVRKQLFKLGMIVGITESEYSKLLYNAYISYNNKDINYSDVAGYNEKLGAYIFKNATIGSETAELSSDTERYAVHTEEIEIWKQQFTEHRFTKYLNSVLTTFGFDGITAYCWLIGGLFAHKYDEMYDGFPVLFLHGQTLSGKTTLSKWIMSIAGWYGEAINWTGSTPQGIIEQIGFARNLPVWVDEYRVDEEKDEIIRATYNKDIALWDDHNGGTKQFLYNGNLLVSGEESPQDTSILNRSIVIDMNANVSRKRDKQSLSALFSNNKSWIGRYKYFNIMKKTLSSKYANKIMTHIEKYANKFSDTIDGRVRHSFAVLLFVADNVLYMDKAMYRNFYVYLNTQIGMLYNNIKNKGDVEVFINDIDSIMGGRYRRLSDKELLYDGNTLYVSFDKVYKLYRERHKRSMTKWLFKNDLIKRINDVDIYGVDIIPEFTLYADEDTRKNVVKDVVALDLSVNDRFLRYVDIMDIRYKNWI